MFASSSSFRRVRTHIAVAAFCTYAALPRAEAQGAAGKAAAAKPKAAAPAQPAAPVAEPTPSPTSNDSTLAPAAPELAPYSDACGRGEWRLEGADLRSSDDAEVAYSADWTPALEQASTCLTRPEYQRNCLRVQGQYDDVVFDERIVAVYGSREATQLARARARASMVVAKLQQLGVTPERLLHVHPGNAPTFRGALVVLSTECGFAPPPANTPPPPPVVVPVTAPTISEAALADEISARLRPKTPAKKEGTFHLDAGLSSSMLLVGDSSVDDPLWAFEGLVAGGYYGYHIYGRIDALLGVGERKDRRFVTDFGAAFGYYHSQLVQVGVRFRLERASDKPRVDAFSSGYTLGLEATQCHPFWGLDFCAAEAFSPLGHYATDVTLQDGKPVRIAKIDSDLMRIDLALFVRFH
jgi:hypothetical protein